MRQKLLAVSLFAYLSAAIQAAPLKLSRGPHGSGKAHVTAWLDGHKQLCVIDSGSVLSIAADPEAFGGYPSFGEIRFQSAAGAPVVADKIRIESLRLDQRVFTNVTVARVDPGDKLRTTIGLSVLAVQPFSLLFRDEASLYLGRKAVNGQPGPIKAHTGGTFTIPLQAGGVNQQAVWDTGAELTAVDAKYVAAHPHQFRGGRALHNVVDGTDQAVAAQLWTMNELAVGRRIFRNVRVVAVDFTTIQKGTAPGVYFVIGFNVIRRADWYFDFPGRRFEIR